jgi:hypothetical protein
MHLPLGKDGTMGELVVQMQFCHVEETTTLRSSLHSLHKQPTPPFPSTVMASIRDCHHHGDIDLTISKARNLAVVQWQVFGKQVRPLYSCGCGVCSVQ